MGKGGKSSSQANQTTTTQSFDNRVVNESGIVAAGGGSIVANIESLDGDIVKDALTFAAQADANNSGDFGKLIEFAASIFTKGTQIQSDALTAVTTAQNDAKGAIDQKTIIILGAIGVAGLVMTKGKKLL